jgi:hypothetical protein
MMVICQLSLVSCHRSLVSCHRSLVSCCWSVVTCQLSFVICHWSVVAPLSAGFPLPTSLFELRRDKTLQLALVAGIAPVALVEERPAREGLKSVQRWT